MMKTIRNILIFATLSLFSFSAFAGPVNVNTANADSLAENIKGVGPKIAAQIISYREANGPFGTVEELQQVKGIGPKTIEKNRDVLNVEGSFNEE